jgi:histidinol-phosphate/aromatic aminotransferase/cobyric acid decarboxylase-like protein
MNFSVQINLTGGIVHRVTLVNEKDAVDLVKSLYNAAYSQNGVVMLGNPENPFAVIDCAHLISAWVKPE